MFAKLFGVKGKISWFIPPKVSDICNEQYCLSFVFSFIKLHQSVLDLISVKTEDVETNVRLTLNVISFLDSGSIFIILINVQCVEWSRCGT